MNRDGVNAIANEMLALYQTRQREPEGRAPHPIDLRHYTDEAQFQLEREQLFRKRPLMLGFSADLPGPGSVKTNDYLDVPILMVRNKAGQVKAYANMCRHRGGRLVDEPTCLGERRNLTCRYHGWVYGLDGELKSVSQENLFGPLDKSRHGLIELPCDERYGMIFVRPEPGAPVSAAEELGAELSRELEAWRFDTLQFVQATTIDTDANWKLQTDTFLESYHVESLHKSTIGPLALSGYALQKSYGHSQRMIFAAGSLPEIGAIPPEDLNGHKHLNIVYMLFPNIFIVYGSLWVQYFEIYPGKTRDTQRTRFALYARKPLVTEAQQQAGRDYFDLNMQFVPTEDYLMGVQTTKAVMCGVERSHMFGHAEATLLHFHTELRKAIGLDPDALFAG